MKYIIFSRLNVFYKVFILNDTAAASYLNRLYNTDKFYYLPDPIASLQNYKPKDIRHKYNIGLLDFENWDIIENELINYQKQELLSVRDSVNAEANWEQAIGQSAF